MSQFSESFIARARALRPHIEALANPGPGTELKKLLAPFISETPTCGCMMWVARMNQMGVTWCQEHVTQIAAQMVAEAQQRGWRLPSSLLGAGAQVLVRTAIARAKSQSSPTPNASLSRFPPAT